MDCLQSPLYFLVLKENFGGSKEEKWLTGNKGGRKRRGAPLLWDKSFGFKAAQVPSSELRRWCSHQRLYPSAVSHLLRVSGEPELSQIPHTSVLILSQLSHLPSASFPPILFGDQGPSSFLTSAIRVFMPPAGWQELQSFQWKPHSVVVRPANTCCASGTAPRTENILENKTNLKNVLSSLLAIPVFQRTFLWAVVLSILSIHGWSHLGRVNLLRWLAHTPSIHSVWGTFILEPEFGIWLLHPFQGCVFLIFLPRVSD